MVGAPFWIAACVSAPAAELPVVHLDLGERVEPRPLVRHERVDSFAIRRLEGQSDSDRLGAIECGECSVEDQPLEQLRRESLR